MDLVMADEPDSLAAAFMLLGSPDELSRFLDDLLSPAERENLSARWRVILELKRAEGTTITQLAIASALGCAPGVVTRANRILKHGTGEAARIAALQVHPSTRSTKSIRPSRR
jgi:uncharacterized protein YerC